jgi:hypothetical protein
MYTVTSGDSNHPRQNTSTTMNTRDETAPEGGSDIYIATASCRKSFETCLSIPVLMENKWAENRLLDFKLWCSGVGALASPPAGLDYRLRTQLDVRAVVLGLLSSLRTLVDFCVQHGGSISNSLILFFSGTTAHISYRKLPRLM